MKLRTNRGCFKYVLLTIITIGIYPIFVWSHISEEINLVASPRDGKHTMHYCLIFFIFTALTLGIAPLVWQHRITNRLGNELKARGIFYNISAGTFWGWGFFGALIIIGPFIYLHKFFKAMNLMNESYNAQNGIIE